MVYLYTHVIYNYLYYLSGAYFSSQTFQNVLIFLKYMSFTIVNKVNNCNVTGFNTSQINNWVTVFMDNFKISFKCKLSTAKITL